MKKLEIAILIILVGCIFAGGASADINDGLVAYYPFNGNANDESGKGHDGTVSGATLAPDKFGRPNRAYSFDGVNDSILLSNTGTLNFTSGGFTLAAWAKFDKTNTDRIIVGKHICANVSGYFLEAGKLGGPSDVFSFYVNNDPRLYTAETYNDGQWHLVVGVYDGTTQHLYVDGALKVSQAKTYVNTNTTNITIGSATNCAYFTGSIDEVLIYDRALTTDEIQDLYDRMSDVVGCFNLGGFPGVNRKVTLRQNLETDQVTYTDRQGCYSFDSANHDKPFSIIIQSNWIPASSPARLQGIASTKDSVNLKWQYAPADATSFKIFRKKGAAGTWQLLNTAGSNDRSYTDTAALGNDLTNIYYYYIKGCNSAGCSSATETVGVPFKATILNATASPGNIGLTWTDNSTIETGYRVFRKDGACSSASTWQKIDDIAADSNAYDDITATSGQPYSYKVQAYYKSAAEPFAYGYALFSNCAGTTAE